MSVRSALVCIMGSGETSYTAASTEIITICHTQASYSIISKEPLLSFYVLRGLVLFFHAQLQLFWERYRLSCT